jgi:hypothetical protein
MPIPPARVLCRADVPAGKKFQGSRGTPREQSRGLPVHKRSIPGRLMTEQFPNNRQFPEKPLVPAHKVLEPPEYRRAPALHPLAG